jgi:N-acetylglucosamine kinase-like BadF-type ATPase
MKYFLGIDVGSSKTHALITDETGTCTGFGKAWGGNHQTVGYDGLENVLKESFEQARQMADIPVERIAGAGFGISGYDFPSDRKPHLQAIAALGLTCPLEVVNDGVNGLLAGATRGIGINVTAGSSNNCRGRGYDGREGRIVGNGPTFGEFGGGIEITLKALHMVNYAWIKRIPPTALTNILLKATGAKDEIDLMEGLSNEQYHLFPFIAIEVIQAARDGDAVAREIIQWAGEELGWLAVSVARQIGMQNDEVEIVQSGSIFKAGDIITNPMRDIVLSHCPKAKIIHLNCPPVVGSVLLGMEQADFDGYAIRERIIQTAKEIVK